ncbi:MAG: hypothetical protein HOK30_00805 [Rhodospirillaceae bacterium]|nr:hypothetical protein [Rhodospirillaceae bacterium]MBT5899116.1 hypothetical protein [Rhodospirillaceae bacterium]MBT6426174.1 hypothetical protein [Rhodospirillaceae bacterium]MBT7757205.1 hypothetical protein [Rhodospirillaceae bacterium]
MRDHNPRIVREDQGQAVVRDTRFQEATAKAAARYEWAAERGYVMAQYNLGLALAEGRGIARDNKRAVEYLQKAARKGNVASILRLAEMHLTGLGTPKDRVEAQALYYVAASLNSKGGAQATVMLGVHLNNEQLELSRERAEILRARMPAKDPARRLELERALMIAAAQGDLKTVHEALQSGVDANAINEAGRTAMIVSAWRGHRRVLQTLLAAGVDINAADYLGRTALSWAAINGYPEIAQVLLREAAMVDVRDEAGLTPLIRAAWNGHEDIVTALIGRQADINAADDLGITALQRAEEQNEAAIVARLRAAGAR